MPKRARVDKGKEPASPPKSRRRSTCPAHQYTVHGTVNYNNNTIVQGTLNYYAAPPGGEQTGGDEAGPSNSRARPVGRTCSPSGGQRGTENMHTRFDEDDREGGGAEETGARVSAEPSNGIRRLCEPPRGLTQWAIDNLDAPYYVRNGERRERPDFCVPSKHYQTLLGLRPWQGAPSGGLTEDIVEDLVGDIDSLDDFGGPDDYKDPCDAPWVSEDPELQADSSSAPATQGAGDLYSEAFPSRVGPATPMLMRYPPCAGRSLTIESAYDGRTDPVSLTFNGVQGGIPFCTKAQRDMGPSQVEEAISMMLYFFAYMDALQEVLQLPNGNPYSPRESLFMQLGGSPVSILWLREQLNILVPSTRTEHQGDVLTTWSRRFVDHRNTISQELGQMVAIQECIKEATQSAPKSSLVAFSDYVTQNVRLWYERKLEEHHDAWAKWGIMFPGQQSPRNNLSKVYAEPRITKGPFIAYSLREALLKEVAQRCSSRRNNASKDWGLHQVLYTLPSYHSMLSPNAKAVAAAGKPKALQWGVFGLCLMVHQRCDITTSAQEAQPWPSEDEEDNIVVILDDSV